MKKNSIIIIVLIIAAVFFYYFKSKNKTKREKDIRLDKYRNQLAITNSKRGAISDAMRLISLQEAIRQKTRLEKKSDEDWEYIKNG